MARTGPARQGQGRGEGQSRGKGQGSTQRAAQSQGRGQRTGQGQSRDGRAGSGPAATRSSQGASRGTGGSGSRPPGTGRPDGTASATPEAAGATARDRDAQRAVDGPPGWLQLTTFVLSLGGLGVSIYLTVTHYFASAVTLACPKTSALNCEKVTTSPQSIVFGIIPVAVVGLAFFVFMVAVNSPLGWRAPWRAVHLARVLSVIVGIGFVLYLIYVELFKVNAICLWCTSVHVITFVLFALILFGAASWGSAARSG